MMKMVLFQLRLNLEPQVHQAWWLKNVGHVWYISKTLNISTKLWLGLAMLASLEEDDFGDSIKDTKIKRNRDESNEYDGPGPSGEGSSSDIPQPKRTQHPNIIERLMPRLGNWIGNLSTQHDSDYEESQ